MSAGSEGGTSLAERRSLFFGNSAGIEDRVLIVDRDEALAGATATLLRAAGWHADATSDSSTALCAMERHAYSVALLGVRSPEIDGLDLLSRVRSLSRPPEVLLAWGNLDAETTRLALRMGAVKIVRKPMSPRELISLLDGYARPSSHISLVKSPPSSSDGKHRNGASMEVAVPEILGDSPAIRLVREQIANVSRYRDMSVLIIGETGTGKELVAQAIHRLSEGKGTPLAINCAAVPEDLFESELFGHEQGSFTGAKGPRVGLFEAAGKGTVFLDEVGEMPLGLQAKLLRVLEGRQFRRVGSNQTLELRARVVSATNRPLRGGSSDTLRSDLFFRLAGYTIRTPPLRERMEDVPILALHLLARFAESYPHASTEISPRAIDLLHSHHWPGNVRELKSVIHSAAARANGAVVGVREIVEALQAYGFGDEPSEAPLAVPMPVPQERAGLRDMERKLVAKTYAESGGNVTITAQRLGIPRTTLRDKLKRYGIR